MKKDLELINLGGLFGYFYNDGTGKLHGKGSVYDHNPRSKKRRGNKFKGFKKRPNLH